MNAVFFYGKKQYLLLAYLAGIALGIFYFFNLTEEYIRNLETYSIYYSEKILSVRIMNPDLIFNVFIQRIKEFFLVFIMGYTSLKNIFNSVYCCFLGFCTCIFIYIATVNYGFWGILVYLATVFPQCFVLVPMILYALHKGGEIKEKREMLGLVMAAVAVCAIEAIIEVCAGYNLFAVLLKLIQN